MLHFHEEETGTQRGNLPWPPYASIFQGLFAGQSFSSGWLCPHLRHSSTFKVNKKKERKKKFGTHGRGGASLGHPITLLPWREAWPLFQSCPREGSQDRAGYRFGLYSLPTGVPSRPGWDPRGQVKRAQKLTCLGTDSHIHKVPCSTHEHTHKHR